MASLDKATEKSPVWSCSGRTMTTRVWGVGGCYTMLCAIPHVFYSLLYPKPKPYYLSRLVKCPSGSWACSSMLLEFLCISFISGLYLSHSGQLAGWQGGGIKTLQDNYYPCNRSNISCGYVILLHLVASSDSVTCVTAQKIFMRPPKLAAWRHLVTHVTPKIFMSMVPPKLNARRHLVTWVTRGNLHAVNSVTYHIVCRNIPGFSVDHPHWFDHGFRSWDAPLPEFCLKRTKRDLEGCDTSTFRMPVSLPLSSCLVWSLCVAPSLFTSCCPTVSWQLAHSFGWGDTLLPGFYWRRFEHDLELVRRH